MGLNTAASISFSQINSTSYFTNGNLGINTTNPTANLDVAGTINASGLSSLASITTGALSATNATVTNVSAGVINSTGLTTGNINFTGSLFQNGVAYVGSQWTSTAGNVSYTSGSVFATNAEFTNAQFTNATINNFSFGTNVTVNNLLASNLNLGISSIYSGSFVASNNVAIATDVTGLAFANANIRSFNASISISLILSAGNSLYEMVNLNGTQNANGWSLYTETMGDATGVTFTITSSGQIQYTSTNQSNWSNTTFRFNVQQFSATGTYSSLSANTQGSYIMDSIQLNSLTDAVPGVSNGPLYILGGATIEKRLNVNGVVSTGGLSVTNASMSNAIATNVSAGVVIASTGLTTGTINATGLSALANATATNVSAGVVIASTGLTAASAQISNENVTTSTIATLRVSSNLLALGNSNTMGSIFTTGGNVGINTATPGSALHVAGPIAITPAGAGVHMGIDLNTFASIQLNSTIGSYIDFATGGIDFSTRIISYSTGNLSISNLADTCNVGINNASPSANLDVVGTIKVSGLSALANVTATNVSTGTLIATTSVTSGLLSATNVVGTSISAGTLSATTITGANMSLSGNLNIAGTLTTVNITSTNLVQTNVSTGTIYASGTSTLQNVTLTNVSAATIQASVTNNTQYVPACSFVNNSIVNGSAVASFLTPDMVDGNTNQLSYFGKSLSTGNSTSIAYYYAGSNNSANYIGLNHYGKSGGLYLLNNGNVGVSTASPAYTLDVAGTGRFANGLTIATSQSADFANRTITSNPNFGLIYCANRPALGNLGSHLFCNSDTSISYMALNDPNYTMQVNGTVKINASNNVYNKLLTLYDGAAGDAPAGATNFYGFGINNSTIRYQVPLSSEKHIFYNGSTGNMTITGSGVGIGTTSPSGMLHLNNAALFTSSGNLTCTGDVVSFGSLSDRRLKKNIETIETAKALDIVSKLRAVSFDWKDDIFNEEKRNTSDLGFIAQEVEELIPEAVSEYTQIESGEVYKNIKHERLVPYLLSAIQYLLSKQT